jgi:hypothetical protein
MRIPSLSKAIVGACVFAATLSVTSRPAAAGAACNELDRSSPCISTSDLKARLDLDEDGKQGRLRVMSREGDPAVELNATNGNVTNLFSNEETKSNGLVKAWAVINSDGTIAACWRCNKDPNETRRIGLGEYEVDFTPLATDIRGRPRVSAPDGGKNRSGFVVILSAALNPDDSSTVQVTTGVATTGAPTNTPFTLAIF